VRVAEKEKTNLGSRNPGGGKQVGAYSDVWVYRRRETKKRGKPYLKKSRKEEKGLNVGRGFGRQRKLGR